MKRSVQTVIGSVALAILFACLHSPLLAQMGPITDGHARQAAIEMELEVILGGAGAVPGPPVATHMDNANRRWMAFAETGDIRIFDEDGVLRSIRGRSGDGPGEFRQPGLFLPWQGDSVLVLDTRAQRVTILRPSGDGFGRSVRLNGAFRDGVATAPPTAILMGRVGRAESLGFPLHRVDLGSRRAEIIASFGSEDPVHSPTRPERSARHVSVGRLGAGPALVLSHLVDYRVEFWSMDGTELLGVVEKRPEWFSETSQWSMGNPETPPPPLLDGAFLDEAGRLWVVARVPRADWADAWPTYPPGTQEITSDQAPDASEVWRSVIEVIDVEAGDLVATRQMDTLVRLVGPTGELLTMGLDEEGEWTVEVNRAVLREVPNG